MQECQGGADAGFRYSAKVIFPVEGEPSVVFDGPASRYATRCGLTTDNSGKPLAFLRGLTTERFDFRYVVVWPDGGSTDLGTCLNTQRPPTMQAMRSRGMIVVGLHGNRCLHDCGESSVALDPMSFFELNPTTGIATPYCLTDAGTNRTELVMSMDSPAALFFVESEWRFLDFTDAGIELSAPAPTSASLIPVPGFPLWPMLNRALVHRRGNEGTALFLERGSAGQLTLREATEINDHLSSVLALTSVDDRFVIVTGRPQDAGISERLYLLFENDVLAGRASSERGRSPLEHRYQGKFLDLLTERTDAGTFLKVREIEFHP